MTHSKAAILGGGARRPDNAARSRAMPEHGLSAPVGEQVANDVEARALQERQ